MSLIKNDSLFNSIFHNSTITSVLLLSKEGNILKANKALEATYGYKEADVQGRNFSMLFIEEDKIEMLAENEIRGAIENSFHTDINYLLHKEGYAIWTNGETTKAIGDDGDIVLIKIFHAIQKEKILEGFLEMANKELNEKNIELEKTIKEQETLVYMASHDLKSPINNIESLVGILDEGLPDDCKDHSEGVIPLIQESIDKFKSSLSDITTSTKDSFKKDNSIIIYFSEILEDVKVGLRQEILSSHALLTEDLSKATISNYAPKVLRSIFYNLISNAIKYRSLERRLELSIKTTEIDSFTIITIRDNGLGINKKYIEQIFGVYKRIPEHTHIEGTGVGLSLVKKLVEENGGKIEV